MTHIPGSGSFARVFLVAISMLSSIHNKPALTTDWKALFQGFLIRDIRELRNALRRCSPLVSHQLG